MVFVHLKTLLSELGKALEKLTDQEYTEAVPLIGGSSIGGHTRHTIEFLQELLEGYTGGAVNYDLRKRDTVLESSVSATNEAINTLIKNMPLADRPLTLYTQYGSGDIQPIVTATSYQREMIYNFEHIVHHMALIRVVLENHFRKTVPPGFGIAPSTLKYKAACAP